MRDIIVSKSSEKFLKKLKKSDSKSAQNIAQHILELQQDSEPHNSIWLTGYYPLRRIRVGKYRIVYKTDNQNLDIELICTRADVYNFLDKIPLK